MLAPRDVLLRGAALHGGGSAEVALSRAPGAPICLEQRGLAAPIEAFRVTRTDRGVAIAASVGSGHIEVDLVEHLFAAIGGLGIREGLHIAVGASELPLLDGGALAFARALASIAVPTGAPPSLRVARTATLSHGASRYTFAPGSGVALRVHVAFPPPVGEEAAEWKGDAADFVERIAPARTFGWVHEVEALRASGRAAAVDLRSVLVFDRDGTIAGSGPAGPCEVARHKLLDLIGDLALYGGPPEGALEAHRPGHTATHAILTQALAEGIVERVSWAPR